MNEKAIKRFRVVHVRRDESGNVIYREGVWSPVDSNGSLVEITYSDDGKKQSVPSKEIQLIGSIGQMIRVVHAPADSKGQQRAGWITSNAQAIESTSIPCIAPLDSGQSVTPN